MAWKFYLIWVPWVLFEIFIVWLVYPETKGPSLEEIAMIFDGPGGGGLDAEKLDVEHAESIGKEKAAAVEISK